MADLVLDEATRRSLLGLMPFTQDGTFDFVPECFKDLPIDESQKPVFTIRAFTKQEALEVQGLYKINPAGQLETNPELPFKAFEYARRITKGWTNLVDLAKMVTLEYAKDKDGGADKELFGSLPQPVINSIYRQASIIAGLLPQEKTGLKSSPESTLEQ